MKSAATLIGDRENPLEADLDVDVVRDDPRVGKRVEVSPVAGGDSFGHRGQPGEITGVFYRYGEVVGYEVEVKGQRLVGTRKDFYTDPLNVLEDVQPPTATAAGVAGALSRWNQPRTYWRPLIDGLESFCFELAGVTQTLTVHVHSDGWSFYDPEPMGTSTVVDCFARFHDNYWTLLTAVYPSRSPVPEGEDYFVLGSEDHWIRTYLWTGVIAKHFSVWTDAHTGLRKRYEVTQALLRPTAEMALPKIEAAHDRLFGPLENPTPLSVGVSLVRLKPGTVAMTEPATDRKPYTTITFSPEVVTPKGDLFSQTVLHELIHYAVASRGGDAHNEKFMTLAKALGLRPEYRE